MIYFLGGKPSILPPYISRLHINPSSSPSNTLRDIMFLDEFDLLVIGTNDGSPVTKPH
jgi:hypothetical protein